MSLPMPQPCPVCGKPVAEPDEFKTGWRIGCVGDRHCVQLYRGASAEEVVTAWNNRFSRGGPGHEQDYIGTNRQDGTEAPAQTEAQ